MLIEASRLQSLPVFTSEGQKLGSLKEPIFNGETGRLAAFMVSRRGLATSSGTLLYEDILLVDPQKISVDTEAVLSSQKQAATELRQKYGLVIGVSAKTESGQPLGKVTDVLIDAQTGIILRFYLHNLLREQIIPRQFLVSITPEQIIFKDIVARPIFNQVANLDPANATA